MATQAKAAITPTETLPFASNETSGVLNQGTNTMATVTDYPLEFCNIGAIERLALSIPPDGGVVVIKGRNGSGKSTAIAATESLVTGKSKPEVRDGGLLTVPQEAWESLDPVNRRLIHDHVRGTGVVLLTAEADAGELRGELFEANEELSS